jgi:ABC-2 type transport system permease protein
MFFLQLKNELRKLFGKPRTYIGFGVFLLFQNLVLVAIHLSNWRRNTAGLLSLNGYDVGDYISALTVAVIMLIPQILLLMPLYTSLIGGDLVAKEAEDGTLRMILSRPISRFRLLLVKWVTGLVFSALLVLALGFMALFFARMWFPWGGLFVFTPVPVQMFNLMDANAGLRHYALCQLLLSLNACTIMSIAFMFSCFNMKPAAATTLAMSFLLVSFVVEMLPFLEEYQTYTVIHHFRAWLLVFAKPTPWERIAQSVCILLAYNITAFVIGAAHFHTRDIKS